MINKDHVKKLADLSRLDLTDEELQSMEKDIASILEYVDVITTIPLPDSVLETPHFEEVNVMREDGQPHESGSFSEGIVGQFPNQQDGYLKVKKILP